MNSQQPQRIRGRGSLPILVLLTVILVLLPAVPAARAAGAGGATVQLSATVGSAIVPTATIDATTLTPPLTWTTKPDLPAGLALDTAAGPTLGVISGTPSAAMSKSVVSVSVTDSATPPVTLTADVTVTVDGAIAPADVSGIVGEPLTPTTILTVTGLSGALTYSAPTAPVWLRISPTGTITGTPDAAVSATVPVEATDASGARANGVLTLNVVPGLVPTTQTLEGRVGVPLVPSSRAFPPAQGSHFTIAPDGPALAGLAFDTSTGVLSGTPSRPMATTTFTIDQVPDAGGGSTGRATVSVSVVGVLASSSSTITGTVNTAISPFSTCGAAAAVSSGLSAPVSFSTIPALPGALSPGDLAIDASTGVVSGTPGTASANKAYTVVAKDANGATATCAFSTVISGALEPASQIYNANTSTRTSSAPLLAQGMAAPLTFSVTPSLPAGLTLNTSTGAISGIAQLTRLASVFTVVATDSTGATATATVTISVGRPVLAAPVITSVAPGSDEGSIQVLFAPPSLAPTVQTYSVFAYPVGGLDVAARMDTTKSPVVLRELEPGATYQVVVVANATAFFDRVESLPRSGVAAGAKVVATSQSASATSGLPVSRPAAATVSTRPLNAVALRRAGIQLASAATTAAKRIVAPVPLSASASSARVVQVPRKRFVKIVVPGMVATDAILVSVKVGNTWLTLGSRIATKNLDLELPVFSVAPTGPLTLRLSADHMRSLYIKIAAR